MMLRESFGIALRSLQANKTRSLLTMLGIIIGVASVVVMIAVGAGAQTRVAEQIRSLGANVLMVMPGTARSALSDEKAGLGTRLRRATRRLSRFQISEVQAAAPSIRGAAQVVRGGKNWNTTVNGTTADYFVIREWALDSAAFLIV